MNDIVLAAVIAAVIGALVWAYRHGKLAGALARAEAEVQKLEGKVAGKVDQSLGHASPPPISSDATPDKAIDQLRAQIKALTARAGA